MRAVRTSPLVGLALLCAVTVLWALSAVAQQTTDSAPQDEVVSPDQAVAVAPVARDSEIEKRITDILQSTQWFTDPSVAVKEGIVFLDGVTNTEERRKWARDLAAKTQDVVAVVNRIAVREEIQWSFTPALVELERLVKKTIATLPLIVLALIVLPLAWYASTWVYRAARRIVGGKVESPLLADIIARAIALPALLIGIYIVLQVAGLTRLALSLLGGAGVLGIIIGFAFRDIAENFLASLLLSIRRPFRAGDFIEVDGDSGLVQSMNTRSTILLSLEGNHVQIPNSTVFKSKIINYSAAANRREVLHLGIGYDASIPEAQETILAVLKAHEAVIDEPAPMVLVDSLGASTVNLNIYYWFNGQKYSALKVRSALQRLIKTAVMEAGISMPDDAREIIFPEGVPIINTPKRSQETAHETAEAIVSRKLEARREIATLESSESVTASEGSLENERNELEAQAERADIPEGRTDLLN